MEKENISSKNIRINILQIMCATRELMIFREASFGNGWSLFIIV